MIESKLKLKLYLHKLSLDDKNVKIYALCKHYQFLEFNNLSFMLIWIKN